MKSLLLSLVPAGLLAPYIFFSIPYIQYEPLLYSILFFGLFFIGSILGFSQSKNNFLALNQPPQQKSWITLRLLPLFTLTLYFLAYLYFKNSLQLDDSDGISRRLTAANMGLYGQNSQVFLAWCLIGYYIFCIHFHYWVCNLISFSKQKNFSRLFLHSIIIFPFIFSMFDWLLWSARQYSLCLLFVLGWYGLFTARSKIKFISLSLILALAPSMGVVTSSLRYFDFLSQEFNISSLFSLSTVSIGSNEFSLVGYGLTNYVNYFYKFGPTYFINIIQTPLMIVPRAVLEHKIELPSTQVGVFPFLPGEMFITFWWLSLPIIFYISYNLSAFVSTHAFATFSLSSFFSIFLLCSLASIVRSNFCESLVVCAYALVGFFVPFMFSKLIRSYS